MRMQPLHFSKLLHLILLLSFTILHFPPRSLVLTLVRLLLSISGGDVTMSLSGEVSDGVLFTEAL